LLPHASAAQPSEKDADAERLFREAQKLMEEHRFAEACPKLESAYRKDHQLGTLLNLAFCHKEEGVPWQAWLEFKEAELKAIEFKRNDRRDFARERMAELEKSLVRVVIDVPASAKVELAEVLVEDHRIPDAEKGAVFAAEAGKRKITFRAKGKKSATVYVSLAKEARPQKVALPEFEEQGSEPPADSAAPPPAEGAASTADTSSSDGSTQRTIGLVLGGLGVIGVGVGAVTGVMTLGSGCAHDNKADAPAKCTDDEKQSGETTGMISTAAFIAGGALLLGGVVLYLTAPHAKTTGRSVTPLIGAGFVGLHGAF
jgi:hypothetical protein